MIHFQRNNCWICLGFWKFIHFPAHTHPSYVLVSQIAAEMVIAAIVACAVGFFLSLHQFFSYNLWNKNSFPSESFPILKLQENGTKGCNASNDCCFIQVGATFQPGFRYWQYLVLARSSQMVLSHYDWWEILTTNDQYKLNRPDDGLLQFLLSLQKYSKWSLYPNDLIPFLTGASVISRESGGATKTVSVVPWWPPDPQLITSEAFGRAAIDQIAAVE